MIFASDLDRTLIYSNLFLDSYEAETTVVEQVHEKPISHMSNRAVALLKAVNAKTLFVPTTTRSLEQFKRIAIFQNKIVTKYAIVANGGIILKDNEVDLEWKKHIEDQLSNLLKPQQLIDKNKSFFDREEIKLYKTCDDLFVYAVFHKKPEDKLYCNEITKYAEAEGYTVTMNGRKLYLIPSFITKWEAIKHIMELENKTSLIAAGDSLLDAPMLVNSSFGIVPVHGELAYYLKEKPSTNSNLHLTNHNGINSSDEFLENVLKLIS